VIRSRLLQRGRAKSAACGRFRTRDMGSSNAGACVAYAHRRREAAMRGVHRVLSAEACASEERPYRPVPSPRERITRAVGFTEAPKP